MGLIITRSVCPCCGANKISKVLDCKDHTVSKKNFEIWQCATCALRFTQHVPDQYSIGPYYQSDTYISHTDTEKGLINKLYKIARNYTLAWKMKLVKRYSGQGNNSGRLLDIGAGTGAFIHQAKSAKWWAQGLEPDERAREVCLSKYQVQLDTPDKLFQLPADEFDAVTMWHVLEHVHELHEYMEQIKRILKKNGVALIALPNYTSWDADYYAASWAAYDVPRHLYHFAPASVRTLATKHGMQVELTRPMWLDAFYIAMLSENYKNGKSNIVSAIMNGLKSNLHAIRNNETCSSLVYIIRKA